MASVDEQLLEQWLRRADAEAFRTLAMQYAGMIYGVCRRILRNATEAEDAAQECLAKLATLGRTDVPLGPWLHRVAVTTCMMRLRSERRRVQREQAYAAQNVPARDESREEAMGRLDEAVAALPDKLRVPVVRHYYLGESHETIAKSLGISRQTVGYRLDKAVVCIRKRLKKEGVLVPVATLAYLLDANLAEAVPAPLAEYAGKLALLGPPAEAITAAAGSGSLIAGILKVAAVLAVAAALGTVGYFGYNSHAHSFRPEPGQVSAALAASLPADDGESKQEPPK
jgi:RNA polymerase sigma factor (sigma-70 family)